MGLFGALFAGVSGLDSQSNKIGIISNNISNVNTVGYKQGSALFNTLVVPSGSTSFSPGGVIGGNRQLVNKQGIISATTSSTDVAISGGGLMVINTKADGSGQTLYTRAGSFTQDANGNFINSNGYYLQALPIEADGSAAQANTQNLTTVSISQSATGNATATSILKVAANLNAAQAVLLGNGATATMQASNGTASINVGNNSTQIIVGNDIAGTSPTNNLIRGSQFTIISGAPANQTDTFTYGGFTIGRSVTSIIDGTTTTGNGDGNSTLDANQSIAASHITTNTTSGTANRVTITGVTHYADYIANQYANISGLATPPASSGLAAGDINGTWKIISSSSANGGSVTLQLSASATGVVTNGGGSLTLTNRTYPFTGNILNATTASSDFLGTGSTAIPPTLFASDALKLTIAVGSDVPQTFTYSSTPDPSNGSFNSLNTLAQAISNGVGLTASVINGRLYVSPTDANQQVIFANGNVAGTPGDSTTSPIYGIDWIQELDLGTLPAAATNTYTFNSLAGLAQQINTLDPTNLVAKVNNASGSASLTINEANPKQTITFSDAQSTSSILKELGFQNLSSDVTGSLTTGLLPIIYDPSNPSTDMSSGTVRAHFSKDVTVYDSQGSAHTIAMNFVKIGTNEWAVELTSVPASDVRSSITNSQYVTGDGQIASGTLSFNGDGSLRTVQGAIANSSVPINWTNGSSASTITLDLGLGGDIGLIQTAAAFNVSTASQNGSPVGELTGVSIDANGFVIASFSNGQTQTIYQVPLASVNNPNGLKAVSGDAYIQTIESGIANLQLAGTSGVGTFSPSALEQSNVDLSTQLTDLIVAQQAYGASSKVLTVTDRLLQQLDQVIQ